MNKLVWRFMKLSGVVLLLYVCMIQVLYRASQQGAAPFKKPKVSAAQKVHHTERQSVEVKRANLGGRLVDKPAAINHVTKPVGKPEPEIPLQPAINERSVFSKRKYNHTLLVKPQQFHDYHHIVTPAIWPDANQPHDDRIISQMTYGLIDTDPSSKRPTKKILVYSGLTDRMRPGKSSLVKQNCPVTDCELTADRSAASNADVILWQNHVSTPSGPRPPGQIWAIFFLESPYHTPNLAAFNHRVNWTSTYRRDSTIVAPYERFTLFNSSVTELPLLKNYAAGKTKKVAWFVSNCGARNNRLGYAHELANHIEVDIFGACGTHSCPRTSKNCFGLLSTTYKFYLAFENSNCKDYITEKFFVNGLKNDVIPIVMGAHPDDYKRAAPKNSYIHVDDFDSPEKLAEYLHLLDKDDNKYNEYFRWKGTGDNINTYFWCRLCAMAHAAETVTTPQVYANVEDWWRGSSVCKEISHNKLWPRW